MKVEEGAARDSESAEASCYGECAVSDGPVLSFRLSCGIGDGDLLCLGSLFEPLQIRANIGCMLVAQLTVFFEHPCGDCVHCGSSAGLRLEGAAGRRFRMASMVRIRFFLSNGCCPVANS
jgi:hypothetical protein